MKDRVVIHHSFTPDQGALDFVAIRRYHVTHNKWRDIGYHVVIETIEDGSPLAILGRALDETGSHTLGQNTRSFGVCIVGNFDEREPSSAVLECAAQHTAGIMRVAEIEPSPRTIFPHSEFAPWKTCPGTLFPMAAFIDLVRGNW